MTALEGKAGLFSLFAHGAWDPSAIADRLGEKFHGEDVSYKPWPSCRGTHAFIEAALHLRPSIAKLQDISAIEASGPPLLAMLMEPVAQKQAPATAIDAKFSLPFCIGAALATGAIAMPTFFEDGRRHAETLDLARRVRFTPQPELGMKDAASGTLTIALEDGRVLRRFIRQARGSPASPLSDADLIAKFMDCAGYATQPLPAPDAMRLSRALLAMSSTPRAADAFAPLRV